MRVKNLFLAVIFVLSLFIPAYGADQRIQYNEKMVGANHPTLADTLNRALMVEHNTDGTHSKLTKVTDPWVDVRAYGAKGDGVTDDTAAVQAALNSGATLVIIPKGSGACVINSLVTIPAGVTLWLNGGTVTGSGATGIFALTLGSNGTSAALIGNGPQSLVAYTGAGSAIQAIGTGQSSADLRIAHLRIAGSSAGASGINLKAFNRGLIENVEIAGFTSGDGIKNEGANSITVTNPNIRNNLNGIHNLTAVVSAVNYSANACRVYGGQIRANSGYGVFEDITGGGGTNIGNGCEGVTFEANGTNGSATSGNVFLQNATGHQYIGNYFEYITGTSPTHGFVVGDATHAVIGTVITGNWFGSVGATNTINNVNGMATYIEDNTESAAVTNFLNHGTLSRNLYLGKNSASGAANYFGGVDTGADSIILGDTGTRLNAWGSTIRGFGFNALSGLNQDLIIRTRGGGVNNLIFQAIDGTQIGSLNNSGQISTADKIYPGTPAAAQQTAAGIYAGTGAPNNANGANGDFYFNAAGATGTTIYQKRAGAWVGIL